MHVTLLDDIERAFRCRSAFATITLSLFCVTEDLFISILSLWFNFMRLL